MVRNKYNENFFEIPSVNNSYWAGFIAGDGHINAHALAINLKRSDEEHLSKLANHLGVNRLYYADGYDKRTGKNYYKCMLRATNGKIVSDLVKVWSIPLDDKTVTLLPPDNLDSDDLYFAWLRGMFDADGCYWVRKNRPNVNLIGTEQVIKWTADFLAETAGKTPTVRQDRRSPNLYMVEYSGDPAIKIRERFRSLDTDFLERKDQAWESAGANLTILSEYVHGTSRMYGTKKCRCDICKAGMKDIWREESRKKRKKQVVE